MGSSPTKSLAVRLTNADPTVQAAALREITDRDTAARLAVVLVTLSGSRHDGVRASAAELLQDVTAPRNDDIAALIKTLDESIKREATDGEPCYWSATLLGRLGDTASAAVSALARVAECSTCLAARERAVWALAEIGPPAFRTIPTLESLTLSGPPGLRRLASKAIDDIRQPISGGEVKARSRRRAA